MATSGTTTYSTTRDDIIKRALRLVGGIGQGETPTAAQTSEAATALNMLVKHLANRGVLLWSRKEISITPVAGQEAYEIGPGKTINQDRPLKVYNIDRYNATTGITVGLIPLSQADFSSVNVSNISSTPSQYWVEPLRDSTKIHFYPFPNTTFAANEVFRIYYQSPLSEFSSGASNPDIPLELYDLLSFGLAERLSFEYGVERFLRKEIKDQFNMLLETSLTYVNEDDSIFFQVDRGF